MEKPRILFVDDEANILNGLRRQLHGMREQWTLEFMTDPCQALSRLDQVRVEVVVSDLRMPGMDGGQFLGEVMRRHPRVVRIMLSGHVDRESALEAVAVSHRLLAKPCAAETLQATVGQALALNRLLDGDTPLKALISRLDTLPSLPSLYARMIHELQSPDASVHSVAAIVAEDPAMTAKLLQLVNSAWFGLRRYVTHLPQAVGLLGLDTVKALVLTAQVFAQFDPDEITAFSVESLWHHSTLVGALARLIARRESADEALANDSLTAGLLHDIGKLMLAANLPTIYNKIGRLVHQEQLTLSDAEIRLFGAAHGEAGAYLLGLWGLPAAIVEAVAYHHHPRQAQPRCLTPLTLVHVANTLAHELSGLDYPPTKAPPLDHGYLESLGLEDRLDEWRRIGRSLLTG